MFVILSIDKAIWNKNNILNYRFLIFLILRFYDADKSKEIIKLIESGRTRD